MKADEPCGFIHMATVRLTWETPYHGPPAPHLLRGALAERFPENSLFHQHAGRQNPGEGRLLYRYPKIQYRWADRSGLVIGFDEGAEALLAIEWPAFSLRLGGQVLQVLEAMSTVNRHTVRVASRLVRYRFRSPWIPFNQKNYAAYRSLDREGKAAERDRMGVSGLLMALRGVGIDFPVQLYAAFHLHRSHTCAYKAQKLLGMTGTLVANVDIPDGLAIGRAVSHGYGWLVRDGTSKLTGETT